MDSYYDHNKKHHQCGSEDHGTCTVCGHAWADDHDAGGCLACDAGNMSNVNPIPDTFPDEQWD